MKRRNAAAVFLPLIILAALGFGLHKRRLDARPAASGILERDRIEIPVLYTERITSILVSEGMEVEAGQIIMKQDSRRAEARLASASAEADRARANLEKLENGPRTQEIEQVRALLRGAEALLLQQTDNLNRVREMDRKNFNSKTELENAESLWKQAQAGRDELQARLSLLEEGSRIEDIHIAEAALAAAEAAQDQARYNMEDLSVRAPRKGFIESIPLKEGATPAAGRTVAVLLADSAPYARVYIPESWHMKIPIGGRAELLVDGVEKPLSGIIRSVSAEPVFTPYFALNQSDRGHLSYAARVDITDYEGPLLKPGTPVRMDLTAVRDQQELRSE